MGMGIDVSVQAESSYLEQIKGRGNLDGCELGRAAFAAVRINPSAYVLLTAGDRFQETSGAASQPRR